MSDGFDNPFGGGFDMNNIQAMLGSVTQRMQQMQAEAAEITAEGQAGAGLVRAKANGRQELLEVRISAEALEDRELLEDLVTAAVNDALTRAKEAMGQKVSDLAGGLPLPPGLF
jgi:DNA-binding YbaB/EbfC family protein